MDDPFLGTRVLTTHNINLNNLSLVARDHSFWISGLYVCLTDCEERIWIRQPEVDFSPRGEDWVYFTPPSHRIGILQPDPDNFTQLSVNPESDGFLITWILRWVPIGTHPP